MPVTPQMPGASVRVRAQDHLVWSVNSLIASGSVRGWVRIQYDDGTWDNINVPQTALTASLATIPADRPAQKDGTIVGANLGQTSHFAQGAVYAMLLICNDDVASDIFGIACSGYLEDMGSLEVGVRQPRDHWATWVFQGTVAEDGTGGTHVCTLTVTPGAGNTMQVLYGRILEGNTATSQTSVAYITDGTNTLVNVGLWLADTSANIDHSFPFAPVLPATNVGNGTSANNPTVSGTMSLVLKVTTTAVSITETFSIVALFRGLTLPTATLAYTVGTPTLTTNTNAVF